MPTTLTRRLAGVQFITQPPDLPTKLPRMDIAIFVGFAAAGPLDCPVVLENPAHFGALFGDDLPLGWDPETGSQTHALLGPSVRAFFRNGGQRCWVIRVAHRAHSTKPAAAATDGISGPPETSVFALPGLVRPDSNDLQPAFARARSAGSGFDRCRAATALLSESLDVLAWDRTSLEIPATPSRQLSAGDLVRMKFTTAKLESYFLVSSTTSIIASPPGGRRQRVAVSPVGTVQWIGGAALGTDTFTIDWTRRPGEVLHATGQVVLTSASAPTLDSEPVVLVVTPDVSPPAALFAPPPGSLLCLHGTTGTTGWFLVDETQLDTIGQGVRGARLLGRAFVWNTVAPASWPVATPSFERLRFELFAQSGTAAFNLSDLGFASAHARYWNALPDDSQRFTATSIDDSIAAANAEIFASLWREAQAGFFPLAGDESSTSVFLPIGMQALAVPESAARHSDRDPLVRAGLGQFSALPFLDPSLIDSSASTLLADADFIRYQISNPVPLVGLHAALAIEEATLIAVPDALHRGWNKVRPNPPPDAKPSDPVAHPAWWHSLACHPPESPPAGATQPPWGNFLNCSLRVVLPPVLSVAGPDASGAFALDWTTADADATFVLEEAMERTFSDAVELWRGTRRHYQVLSRTAGVYYFRVRSEAEGETSEWSNGVGVACGIDGSWQIFPLDAFQSYPCRDVHRALLRFCAARGDILAVLALPEHFREDASLAYVAELKATRDSGEPSLVRPLSPGEERAYSFGALYHPWLLGRNEPSGLRSTPPDGAASGIIAQRALGRGAWIAPANHLLAGVVALSPRIMPARHLDLLLAQVNLLRQEPAGFLALNADTLSDDDDLRPINVRRLLILLRRAALQLGQDYVFEPNDATLARMVRGAFESLLQRLFMRGAFAGGTPDTSYRVVTDNSINPRESVELGRFFIDLKVAPSRPLAFITVRLVQTGERAVASEIS